MTPGITPGICAEKQDYTDYTDYTDRCFARGSPELQRSLRTRGTVIGQAAAEGRGQ
jgi:hypothetical protein